MKHRDRFMAAPSKAIARRRLRIQRARLVEAFGALRDWPWIYTNAGVLAEAAAHWAFVAFPDLRVDDDNADGIGLSIE